MLSKPLSSAESKMDDSSTPALSIVPLSLAINDDKNGPESGFDATTEPLALSSKIFRLQVGQSVFVVQGSTLGKSSYFRDMLRDSTQTLPFIDRSECVFPAVLAYLRTNTLLV